jgi:hypothetical protein
MGVKKKENRTIATYCGFWAWPIMRPRYVRCLKATATRVLRRFSRTSAHPRPGLGLEVGIIGPWSIEVWRPCGLEAPHCSAGRLCLCREIGPCRSVEVEDMGLNKERVRAQIARW